jgi:ferric-dicitrate binding protein FerR (iron transport regulator)
MSEFKYPVRFTGDTRGVELSGEAYFEVSHSGKPFIVRANQTVVRVLGTCFNVNAYENTGKVVTTLVKGSVMVNAKDGRKASYILSPDQQAVFDSRDLSWQVKTVDISLYTGWKEGEFIFYDNRLEDIMNTLGRWYSVDVDWTNPKLKDIRFSGSLNKYNDLSEILEIIQATNKVKIEINNTTIVFKEV